MRDISIPLKAPTAMKPACPSESSPDIPTTRFRETASETYTQIGTNWPCRLCPIRPAAVSIWNSTYPPMRMPYEMDASLRYSLPLTAFLRPLLLMFLSILSAMAHLHFLADLLAQQAGRLDKQNDDQTCKYDGV